MTSPSVGSIGATLERAEELHGSDGITGVATGFRDLDAKLAGLQPANMVVIAGRPSMGKTSLALNICTNIAMRDEPVAIFSLEMSREEVAQRLLCATARVDSQKLRTGDLSQNQWAKLTHAAGALYNRPIFIDDSASLTVTEIRAKCRRLQRQKGLQLAVVDYMQLMNAGGRAENRQQEIAEISRGLKNLARELRVPIIAASQLNRAVEQREDKRPRLGDLRECLTANTVIRRSDNGDAITIGEVARRGLRDLPVWSLTSDFKIVASKMKEAWSTGVKPVFKVKTASGRVVRGTSNHPLLTIDGWIPIGALGPGDRIAVPRRLPAPVATSAMNEDELVLLAHLVGDGSYLRNQPLRYTSADEANLAVVAAAARRRFGVTAKADDLPDASTSLRLPSPYHLTHGRRNPINAWLDGLGVFDQRSRQKRLPSALFAQPDRQIRMFLHHLWATDGSISIRRDQSRCSIYYSMSSRGLAEDVSALLLRLNYQPRIHPAHKAGYEPTWMVRISGRDQEVRFLEEVGCHGAGGRVVPSALDLTRPRIANTNVDTVPVEVWDRVRAMMPEKGVTHRQLSAHLCMEYCGTAMFKPAPSRGRLASVAEFLDEKELECLANSDVLWDTIHSIEPDGEEETFDAIVPGTHNFVAGDVIVHNSGALEQDSDVVMFIYRHEYYHPEAQESLGVAEVNIAKHRSGATGRVDMTFLPEFTLFSDMGRDVAA